MILARESSQGSDAAAPPGDVEYRNTPIAWLVVVSTTQGVQVYKFKTQLVLEALSQLNQNMKDAFINGVPQ